MENKLNHIAIIMDGNGRWAISKGLPTFQGHKSGVDRIEGVVKVGAKHNVNVITVYAFSKENWQRSQEEVSGLLKLVEFFYNTKLKKLIHDNVKVIIMGEDEGLPESTKKLFDDIEMKTKDNDGIILNIAFNYSSRDEIVRAANLAFKEKESLITLDDIEKNLYTAKLPEVDLLIRTSGEQRISNFLLWQLSYSELVFTDVLWPDFDENEFEKCIDIYKNRNRRFGKR